MTAQRDGEGRFRFIGPTVLSALILLSLLSESRLATAASAHIVYVTSEGAGTVTGVDAGSLEIRRRVDIGHRPHNLEATSGGLLAVATQGIDAVSIVDPIKDSATVNRVGIGAPPHDLAVGADGRTVHVVSERDVLVSLDPASVGSCERSNSRADRIT